MDRSQTHTVCTQSALAHLKAAGTHTNNVLEIIGKRLGVGHATCLVVDAAETAQIEALFFRDLFDLLQGCGRQLGRLGQDKGACLVGTRTPEGGGGGGQSVKGEGVVEVKR